MKPLLSQDAARGAQFQVPEDTVIPNGVDTAVRR